MSASDPETDNLSDTGWEGIQVCGGDHVDVDGGQHRGGETAADPDSPRHQQQCLLWRGAGQVSGHLLQTLVLQGPHHLSHGRSHSPTPGDCCV